MAKKNRKKHHGPNPVAPLNNHQLNHMANQILHPIIAQGNHQAEAAQGFGTALANIYGGIAPTVQHAYDNAANQTAGYANGFSTGLQLTADQTNQAANASLAQQGSPQQLNSGAGASDALYGAGGYLPASSLQREGAAWTAAAAQAPTYAGNQARQDATRLRMEAIQQMAQQRPQIMQALRDFELQKYAARINAGYLGVASQNAKTSRFNANVNAANTAHDNAVQDKGDKADKNKDRQEFFNNVSDDALDAAHDLTDGKPNPNYNQYQPPGPGNPETIQFKWGEAYKRLWNGYGKKLLRKGYPKSRVKQMIRESLISAGFHPPKKAGPGGHVGGQPLPHD